METIGCESIKSSELFSPFKNRYAMIPNETTNHRNKNIIFSLPISLSSVDISPNYLLYPSEVAISLAQLQVLPQVYPFLLNTLLA
jgi:hypothetical protein